MSLNTANSFGVMGKFYISGKKNEADENIEQMNFNIIEIPIPTYTCSPILINRGSEQGSLPSTKIEKEYVVNVQFILDEEMKVYFALQTLMKKYSKNGKSDDLLIIQKLNNDNKVIANGAYNKVWINSISSLIYNVQTNETITYVNVGIAYLDFDITPN